MRRRTDAPAMTLEQKRTLRMDRISMQVNIACTKWLRDHGLPEGPRRFEYGSNSPERQHN